MKQLLRSKLLTTIQLSILLGLLLILVWPVITQFKLNQYNPNSRLALEETGQAELKLKPKDNRVQILKDYLAKFGSPMQKSARDFVEAADKYGMDWKLVPSIAGVESTFGKRVPGGIGEYSSYNGWGWGVYGTQAIYFKSWKDGIYTVSEGLKKNYIDKGLVNPMAMNRVYAASTSWGTNVTFFLNDLTKFEANYPVSEISAPKVEIEPNKEAGGSAKIVSALELLANR